jgi:hypothetical protein
MGVVLSERDYAIADLVTAKVLAALEAKQAPKVSGNEAAELLGICYATLKSQHIDAGDLFYIPGTKRFWRSEVLQLKRKRERAGLSYTTTDAPMRNLERRSA